MERRVAVDKAGTTSGAGGEPVAPAPAEGPQGGPWAPPPAGARPSFPPRARIVLTRPAPDAVPAPRSARRSRARPTAPTPAPTGAAHPDPIGSDPPELAAAPPAGPPPPEARRPRDEAAADAVRRAAPDARIGPMRPERATFAVLVGFS